MSAPKYQLLDHTADIAFEAEASTWAELLEASTAALGAVMLAVPVGGEVLDEIRSLEVEGADREDVLVAWLQESVLLLDDEALLIREATVAAADADGARGVLRGRWLDASVEPPDRVVKAVTYHDLRVVPGDDETPWRAVVVLDL